jgi:hypothetical protein
MFCSLADMLFLTHSCCLLTDIKFPTTVCMNTFDGLHPSLLTRAHPWHQVAQEEAAAMVLAVCQTAAATTLAFDL